MFSGRHICFVILILIGQLVNAGEAVKSIYDLNICKGLPPPKISRDEIMSLREQGYFPKPMDRLGQSIARVKDWVSWQEPQLRCKQPVHDKFKLTRPVVEVEKVLAEVSSTVADSIAEDIKTQKRLMIGGLLCSRAFVELEKMGTRMADVTAADLEKLPNLSVNPHACVEFKNKDIKNLKERLTKLRAAMALRERPVHWEQPLTHDASFVDDVIGLVLPDVWKRDSKKTMSPITPDEKKAILSQAKIETPAEALRTYDAIISTTPIVLFFDSANDVNPQSLAHAFETLLKQNKVDAEEMKDPPQDILFKVPYLVKMIEGMGDSDVAKQKKADACVVLDAIHDNLVAREKNLPIYVAAMGVMASLISAGGLSSVGFAGFNKAKLLNGLSWSASGGMGVAAFDNYSRYSRAVNYCTGVAIEESDNPTYSGLCDFGGAREKLGSAKESAILGATGFGGMRLIKRFIH